MRKDELGTRMKTYYEQIPSVKLMRRVPVAVRLDGRSFHTFTRGLCKPYDHVLAVSMYKTMKYLCEKISGCVFGYTQSDEITLLLIDYQTLETSAFFDYKVQKLCSVIASMCSVAFNKYFHEEATKELNGINPKYVDTLKRKMAEMPVFDCRVFNIPKEEACNLVYWRQVDCYRNAVQLVGQANFSHKQLQGLGRRAIKDKLMTEKNIDFDNDYPTWFQRGICCVKNKGEWKIDLNMPMLVGENRKCVNDTILYEEN